MLVEEKRRYRRGGWHETQIGGVGRCLHGVFRYSEAGISKTLYRKRLKQASSLVTATRSAQSLSCSSCTHRAPNLKASFLQKACSCSCVAPSKPVGRPSSLNVILQKRERPGCLFLEAGGGRGCRDFARRNDPLQSQQMVFYVRGAWQRAASVYQENYRSSIKYPPVLW